jgi:antitoxin ParD1/3/4
VRPFTRRADRVVKGTERIAVVVTPEMAAMLRAAVEGGEYVSPSEVIREALRLWHADRQARAREVEELRRLWQEGTASGSDGPLDMEAIKAEGRALLDAEGPPALPERERRSA